MRQRAQSPRLDDSISASWNRCENQHRLVRSTAKPVLRLQASEVMPRLDELLDRTGGRLGVFSELAKLGTDAGHALVVTDADGVVVRFDSHAFAKDSFERNGIGLGSCWDERISGTNGVSMSMLAGDAVTVRGDQHFHRCLAQFACTAVPLLDADNTTIGAVSFSVFDKSSPSDYLLAKQLLLAAAAKVQRRLFEAQFAERTLVTVSSANPSDLLQRKGLLAIDDNGVVIGATNLASELVGVCSDIRLAGQPIDSVFGVDAQAVRDAPGHVFSVTGAGHAPLNLSVGSLGELSGMVPGWSPNQDATRKAKARRRLSPILQDLACGSRAMATKCARVEAHIRRAFPVVIQGESGTGKSALVTATQRSLGVLPEQVTLVDCATLSDDAEHREYVRNLCSHARAVQAMDCEDQGMTILVFDNVDEMPCFAQSMLRSLLEQLEREAAPLDAHPAQRGLRVVAISRTELLAAVRAGRLRDDVYYLLSSAIVTLPPLRQREELSELAHSVGSQIAGKDVSITREALDLLAAHDWPGNVRELRNVLQQALMEGDGEHVSPIDLSALTMGEGCALAPALDHAEPVASPRFAYDEKTKLLDALTSANWNVSEAARSLGIGRATINRKIKRHGLMRPN